MILKQLIEKKLEKYPDEKKLDLLTSLSLGEIFPYSDDEISEATEAIRESISPSGPDQKRVRKKRHDVRGDINPDGDGNSGGLFECTEDAIRLHCQKLKEREDK